MSIEKSPDSFMFTVGKLDAGMAILLGERAHLIEFPSILLPPGATTGSIVNIAVNRNVTEEKRRESEFWALQDDILNEFGINSPEPPKLQLRNVTQTSVTLEWPTIELATSKLRSLDIYRNGQRLAAIPSPHTNTSTKLSGLELNTEYTFQLILRTTAGTYPSNLIRVRTHTMTDTSGICVCFGNVQDEILLENAKLALREMGGRWSEKIQIDTTHFVCTTPAVTPGGAQATGGVSGAPGVEYQRALQLSIPVVQPLWILACHSEKKMMPIASFYLGATPINTPNTSNFNRPQSMSQANLSRGGGAPTTSPPPPGNHSTSSSHRASMPPPARSSENNIPTSAFVNQNQNQNHNNNTTTSTTLPAKPTPFEPTPEELGEGDNDAEDDDGEDVRLEQAPAAPATTSTSTSNEQKRRSHNHNGSMNRDFKFPSPVSSPVVASKPGPLAGRRSPPEQLKEVEVEASEEDEDEEEEEQKEQEGPRKDNVPVVKVVTPSNIEVPPPPPVEKERLGGGSTSELDDDLLPFLSMGTTSSTPPPPPAPSQYSSNKSKRKTYDYVHQFPPGYWPQPQQYPYNYHQQQQPVANWGPVIPPPPPQQQQYPSTNYYHQHTIQMPQPFIPPPLPQQQQQQQQQQHQPVIPRPPPQPAMQPQQPASTVQQPAATNNNNNNKPVIPPPLPPQQQRKSERPQQKRKSTRKKKKITFVATFKPPDEPDAPGDLSRSLSNAHDSSTANSAAAAITTEDRPPNPLPPLPINVYETSPYKHLLQPMELPDLSMLEPGNT
ncbi:hypothetical protein H0H93_015637, partial [Arthromyces matolae]